MSANVNCIEKDGVNSVLDIDINSFNSDVHKPFFRIVPNSSSSASSSSSRSPMYECYDYMNMKEYKTNIKADSRMKIAVIDDKIFHHEWFEGKKVNFTHYDLYPGNHYDDYSHSTHVMGIIRSMVDEKITLDVLNYKVFGTKDSHIHGQRIDEYIARSIYHATQKGCKVINMSLGGPASSKKIKQAIKYAYSNKVVIIVAAGNEGDNDFETDEFSYPAMYPQTISTAAINREDNKTAEFSCSNKQVDYAAPGFKVYSTIPNHEYARYNGTSMACPVLAGLIITILTINPKLSFHDVVNFLDSISKQYDQSRFLVGQGIPKIVTSDKIEKHL